VRLGKRFELFVRYTLHREAHLSLRLHASTPHLAVAALLPDLGRDVAAGAEEAARQVVSQRGAEAKVNQLGRGPRRIAVHQQQVLRLFIIEVAETGLSG
jgi:hypothetical protein